MDIIMSEAYEKNLHTIIQSKRSQATFTANIPNDQFTVELDRSSAEKTIIMGERYGRNFRTGWKDVFLVHLQEVLRHDIILNGSDNQIATHWIDYPFLIIIE